MRTDERRNEDLDRLKSTGGLFACAAELTYIIGYINSQLVIQVIYSKARQSVSCLRQSSGARSKHIIYS